MRFFQARNSYLVEEVQPRVELLENSIHKEGTHSDQRKVKAINDAHSPSNRKGKILYLE